MSFTIKQCTNCENNIKLVKIEDKNFINYMRGIIKPDPYYDVNKYFPDIYYNTYREDYKNNICPYCKKPLIDTLISKDDFYAIGECSDYNRALLLAMIDLRKKDVIEFETKMQSFRNEYKKREEDEKRRIQESLKPECPKCGSKSITAGQKGYSLLTGFIGSDKTVNRCASCGYKWKP